MKKNIAIQNIFYGFLLTPIFFLSYACIEPVLVKAVSDDVGVSQSVASEIAISSPADITMSPEISGLTGGMGEGSATWTVITNDTSGFNLSLKASTDPALASGSYNFADYTIAAAVPDFVWSVAADASEFGFTIEAETAADLVSDFLDDGSVCGAGASDTADACWGGFSTSDQTVVNRASQTDLSGEDEVIKFRAESGASRFQEFGEYVATITVTAVTN